MPERQNLGSVPDQESDATSETGGEMDIDYLWLSSRSLSRLYFEVGGTICPGFEIGWVNSIKVCLYYRHRLIGSMYLRDTPLIPNAKKYVKIEWDDDQEHEMDIRDMVGFKSLFDDIMPKKGADYSYDDKKRMTAALSVSPNGHVLTMSIDLGNMPRMRPEVKSVKLSGRYIEINMEIVSSSPLTQPFEGASEFVIKKGEDTVGKLTGSFSIKPGTKEVSFNGTIRRGVSGMVTLQGDHFEHCLDHKTWQSYIIKLFEVEIDMDKAIIDYEHDESDDEDGDGSDESD
ncbi:hypothetical protein T069G_07341 [Trichoderma breve]|uniref:Uncharacterized protein n=1 Tax=Trichoderma breve TaxID=2034170 RepID=A0A9W9BD04_9HYPO|nr:hypothetical protein T069G_07341 [Trichoderma breve]KAJ4859074.1 hypothetical protein T069G_07341 [Trichoderma breve]